MRGPDVQWAKRARLRLERLDRPTRERIIDAVNTFAATGQGDVKRLKGELANLLRLRVGGWRILIAREDERMLTVETVVPRGDAY